MTLPAIVTLPLLACCSGLNCSIFPASLLADSTLIVCVSSFVCAQTTISGSPDSAAVTASPKANLRIECSPLNKIKSNVLSLNQSAKISWNSIPRNDDSDWSVTYITKVGEQIIEPHGTL